MMIAELKVHKIVTFLESRCCYLYVNKQNANALETFKGKNDLALTEEGFDQFGHLAITQFLNLRRVPLFWFSNTKGQFKLNENNSDNNELKIGLHGSKDVPFNTYVHTPIC